MYFTSFYRYEKTNTAEQQVKILHFLDDIITQLITKLLLKTERKYFKRGGVTKKDRCNKVERV